ncbi:MAG: gamma-glutamyl-phosphate reductase, partial [Bacteroidales bacterium]|nr:gamma-glutamyl-phosphate reductase [Bacteroidales bacterium]
MDLQETFRLVQAAGRKAALLEDALINKVILDVADAMVAQSEEILEANRQDLARMDPADPKYDRLMLTPERIAAIADDQRNVVKLPSPLDHVLSSTIRPNGLVIEKVSVPFGVIGIIYEARPNVTPDVFSLCLKSGNACILKGGSDAEASNKAIISFIHRVLEQHGIDIHTAELLPSDRQATTALLHAEGFVDLIIPR